MKILKFKLLILLLSFFANNINLLTQENVKPFDKDKFVKELTAILNLTNDQIYKLKEFCKVHESHAKSVIETTLVESKKNIKLHSIRQEFEIKINSILTKNQKKKFKNYLIKKKQKISTS